MFLTNIKEAMFKNFYIFLIVSLIFSMYLPQHSLAHEVNLSNASIELEMISSANLKNIPEVNIFSIFDAKAQTSNTLPVIEDKEADIVTNFYISAYNSLPGQTDDTPCITASGLDVCERNMEDIVATNYRYLPFGSIIKIPELFGNKEFIVHDRMNKRYTNTLDIWMKDYKTAKAFGRKYVEVEIYIK